MVTKEINFNITEEPELLGKSEFRDMLRIHFYELAPHKDKYPFDPMWEAYEELLRLGKLILVSCRDSAGELAGYFVGLVIPHMHSRNVIVCMGDNFYVSPKFRGHNLGFKLFKKVEEVCKQHGVQRFCIGSEVWQDASFLFEKLGYKEIERYFDKWLGN